jgi:hypothetical protein
MFQGHYEATTEKFVNLEAAGAYGALMSTAYDIDQLVKRLTEDARRMAEHFTTYADRLPTGQTDDCPARYTNLSSMAADQAVLTAKKQSFMMLLAAYGVDRKEFTKVLNKSYESSMK